MRYVTAVGSSLIWPAVILPDRIKVGSHRPLAANLGPQSLKLVCGLIHEVTGRLGVNVVRPAA
jgi:hypothetical protein